MPKINTNTISIRDIKYIYQKKNENKNEDE